MSEADPLPDLTHQEYHGPPDHPRDPWVWCLAIPLALAALASIRLTTPSVPMFDEVHYLPAAREWLTLLGDNPGRYINPEHPPLGKQIIALGIYLFGDNPLGWRIMSLVFGMVAAGAAMRALWHASQDRAATIMFGILLVTGFHLFVHARIAILDIFMAAFLALAAWFFASAIRKPEQGRWRLAICGAAIGLALASKWNAIPLAVVPGLAFFAARFAAGRKRLITSTRGIPVPGISLAEAFVWLGILPLAVYALTYLPGAWLNAMLLGTDGKVYPSLVVEKGLIGLQLHMYDLQQQVIDPHPYMSTWEQWVLNTRGIWYLYEHVDGAQRGVLMIGNPLTMLLGLPALLYCLIYGLYRSDWAKLAVAIGFAVSLGFWLFAPKPVQFYYHYIMPSLFLLGALALTLGDLWHCLRWRWVSVVTLIGSAAMFAFFWPILTAAELSGERAFLNWTWIEGWM